MISVAQLILRALLEVGEEVDECTLYERVHRAAAASGEHRARLAPWSPWARAFSEVLDGLGAAGLVEVRDALGRRRRDEDPDASRVLLTDRGRTLASDPGTLARVSRLLGFQDTDVLPTRREPFGAPSTFLQVLIALGVALAGGAVLYLIRLALVKP